MARVAQEIGRLPYLAKFRIYPERGKSLYLVVRVWPCLATMMKWAKWEGHNAAYGRTTKAYVASYLIQRKIRGRWRNTPEFAQINLIKRALGTETLTHEALHATLAWARRIRFPMTQLDAPNSVNGFEERLCYAHGRIARRLVSALYKAKVLR